MVERLVLVCGLLLALSGCRAQTALDIKMEFKGSAEWKTSEAAFKAIMRHYVHGENASITDEQLSKDFDMYVSLSTDDVKEFLEQQSCLPRPGTASAQYYMVNSTHQRHDAHFAINQPEHHMAGSGHGKAHATFTANMLLERYPIEPGKEFPARARMKGGPFPDWHTMAKVLTDETTFQRAFTFLDPEQGAAIFTGTKDLDFEGTVRGELFMAPKLHGGDVFSPALFAVYVLRANEAAPPSVYLVVSANAEGEPQTEYVGLIDPNAEPVKSVTGFAFTYLSTPKNLLNYEFVLTDTAPLAFELWITTAFPDHTEQPYLTVRSAFAPAVSQKTVTRYKDSPMTRLILMIRKGALMRDLVKLYYPDSKSVELWNDVGAIHGTRFRQKMEAIGLNLAVDLFDRDLWLKKPTTGGNAPLEFKLGPGELKECPVH